MFFKIVFRIYDEYSLIANTLLTPPPDTGALMELIEYCKKVEDVMLSDMEDKLRNVMRYIMFLGDYTTFTPLEMKANNQTYHWLVLYLLKKKRSIYVYKS